MEKQYKIVGKAGNLIIEEPAEGKMLNVFAKMRFVEYVKDEDETVTGVKFVIDEGHGYGFNYGTKVVTLAVGEELEFEHYYTDTSEGSWDDGSFTIKVRLLEEDL